MLYAGRKVAMLPAHLLPQFLFMRTILCFFILGLSTEPSFSQTIVCDTSAFVYNYFMRVTAPSGVNLRAAPSQQAAKLVAIPYGAEIPVAANYTDEQLPVETIEDKYASWYKAAYAGKTGYVFGGFLEDARQKTSVRLLIPEAGVESIRSELGLDPDLSWFALAPNEKERPRYSPDIVQMQAQKVVLDTLKLEGFDDARHRPLNAPENTLVFFGGIRPDSEIKYYYQPEESEMLYPGATISFPLFDEQLKQQRLYCLYANGQPVSAPQSRGNWPFSGIRNYELRVREVAYSPSGYRVVSDQLLFSGNLDFDPETGRMYGPRLFLMGDFDNDHKLDIILDWQSDKGTVFYLFLSSKTLPGFMMRVVAMVADSCC